MEFYKTDQGNLPCKLFLAAAREQSTAVDDKKVGNKYRGAKRRKKNIDVDEMLIVNRES